MSLLRHHIALCRTKNRSHCQKMLPPLVSVGLATTSRSAVEATARPSPIGRTPRRQCKRPVAWHHDGTVGGRALDVICGSLPAGVREVRSLLRSPLGRADSTPTPSGAWECRRVPLCSSDVSSHNAITLECRGHRSGPTSRPQPPTVRARRRPREPDGTYLIWVILGAARRMCWRIRRLALAWTRSSSRSSVTYNTHG
jgi:hypothetical protein